MSKNGIELRQYTYPITALFFPLITFLLLLLGSFSLSANDKLSFISTLKDTSNLFDVSDLVVSPDGEHLYTASSGLNSVAAYQRDLTTGSLALIERIEDPDNLEIAFGLDISADGKNVYVSSAFSSAITVYSRDNATGRLTFLESKSTNKHGFSVQGFLSVTVSKDGSSVYATAAEISGLVVFQRDIDSGSLTFLEEHVAEENGNLLSQKFDPYVGPTNNIAISKSGKYLYVSSTKDNAISVYARNSQNGALTLQSSLIDGENGVDGIEGASSLTLSHNDKFLFVSGQSEHSVAVFSVNSQSGALTFIEKQTDELNNITSLDGARALITSFDDNYLFVSAIDDKSISVFNINNTTGALSLMMFAQNERDNVDGLDGVSALALAPSGHYLYSAGQQEDAISIFRTPHTAQADESKSTGGSIALWYLLLLVTMTVSRRRKVK